MIDQAKTTSTSTTTTTTRPNPTAEFIHRSAWKAGVLGTLNALFVILAVRAILLIAVIGAFILSRTVLDAPPAAQTPALIMLAVYCATVVLPIVWLSSRK